MVQSWRRCMMEQRALFKIGSLPHKGLIKASEGARQPAPVAWLCRPGFLIRLSVSAVEVLHLCADAMVLLQILRQRLLSSWF